MAVPDILIRDEEDHVNYNFFDGIQHGKYFSEHVEPGKDNRKVWDRVINGNSNDPSILAIGFENAIDLSEYIDVRHDTTGSSRTVFLSGGTFGLERVSAEDYNHIYVDFYTLEEDVPYMINSRFFDYIVVGVDTFRYMTRAKTVIGFANMLSDKGAMILPLKTFYDRTLVSISDIFSEFKLSIHLKERGDENIDEIGDEICDKKGRKQVLYIRGCYAPKMECFSSFKKSKNLFTLLREANILLKRYFDAKHYVKELQGYAAVSRK
jgi:hypothetical protein